MTALTVIICTYQPDRALLARVLAALGAQAEAPDHDIIVVDNRSDPPLDEAIFSGVVSCTTRIVSEPIPGLAAARARGIEAASGELLVFVDDDNILAPDYLEEAARVAGAEPSLGAFAGRARGVFEQEPDWLIRKHIARYAVRDLGDEMLIGSGERWGLHEPFGAGLVVRADVANAFARIVRESGDGGGLGRTGRSLASGEDSLMSRIADALGYQVGYAPRLRLDHHIKSNRMSWRYLFRLIAGQARAHVALDRISGWPDPVPPPPTWREPDFAVRRFLGRLRNPGLHEAITHIAWDHAYWDAQRAGSGPGEVRMARALETLREAGREGAAGC